MTEKKKLIKSSPKDLMKDELISQLQMLRMRLINNITDIDDYVESIKRRFETLEVKFKS